MNRLGVGLLLAAIVLSPTGRIEGPIGSGAGSVWVLRPKGSVQSVVVFAHGWKRAPPSPAHPWVAQFAPWLAHLVAEGNAVIFPRYQLGGDAAGPATIAAFRRGLQLGFRRLGGPDVPVIAVGYSYGASLVFYYAAEAERWGLRAPEAVDSIFPVGPIPGAPLPAIPASLRVLIEVGDRDTVAGRSGAEAWWTLLRSQPPGRKRFVVVRSGRGFEADHASPKSSGLAARRAFWAPLDRLLAQARAASG
jgi:pimeloyl-ACP methyl ester carboxylesterase